MQQLHGEIRHGHERLAEWSKEGGLVRGGRDGDGTPDAGRR